MPFGYDALRAPRREPARRPAFPALRLLAGALIGWAAAWVPAPEARAAAYPERPVRLIVPYPPGGPTDLIARVINDRLSERLGQQVVIDNRSGAATVVGTEIAARSRPDGYTLLVGTVTTLAINPVLKRDLPYHPVRDFAPVCMLGLQPYLLVAHPSVPAASVQQLVAFVKANPGKLNFATAGVGTGAHLAAELFNYLAGVKIGHVPYKGTGPASVDVIGGHVALLWGGISALRPHVQAGKLKVFAVSSARRSAGAPEVPTIAESGVPGYDASSWNSLVVPRGTPQAIVNRLNAETVAVLTQPDVRERLRQQGVDTEPGTPDQLAAHVRKEYERISRLVGAMGLKVE